MYLVIALVLSRQLFCLFIYFISFSLVLSIIFSSVCRCSFLSLLLFLIYRTDRRWFERSTQSCQTRTISGLGFSYMTNIIYVISIFKWRCIVCSESIDLSRLTKRIISYIWETWYIYIFPMIKWKWKKKLTRTAPSWTHLQKIFSIYQRIK